MGCLTSIQSGGLAHSLVVGAQWWSQLVDICRSSTQRERHSADSYRTEQAAHTLVSFADASTPRKTKAARAEKHTKRGNISSATANTTLNIAYISGSPATLFIPIILGTVEGIKALTTHLEQSSAFTILGRSASERETPQFEDEPDSSDDETISKTFLLIQTYYLHSRTTIWQSLLILLKLALQNITAIQYPHLQPYSIQLVQILTYYYHVLPVRLSNL